MVLDSSWWSPVSRTPTELIYMRIPPIGFFPVEIRAAGPCRGGVHTLHGCVTRSPIWGIRAWRAWRLPRRWPDGGRRSTVARWTRWLAATAYAPIFHSDLTYLTLAWRNTHWRGIYDTCTIVMALSRVNSAFHQVTGGPPYGYCENPLRNAVRKINFIRRERASLYCVLSKIFTHEKVMNKLSYLGCSQSWRPTIIPNCIGCSQYCQPFSYISKRSQPYIFQKSCSVLFRTYCGELPDMNRFKKSSCVWKKWTFFSLWQINCLIGYPHIDTRDKNDHDYETRTYVYRNSQC